MQRRSVLGVHWKDWYWSWNSNTLATWCEELTHWKRCWCWERLRAGREGDNRGWDVWMASLTQWTWVRVDSGSWWWREAWCAAVHGVTKSQIQLSDWTELNWTVLHESLISSLFGDISLGQYLLSKKHRQNPFLFPRVKQKHVWPGLLTLPLSPLSAELFLILSSDLCISYDSRNSCKSDTCETFLRLHT